jgi:hypothetical protein
MSAYWIFVFSEFTDFSRGSTDELFSRLGRNPKWCIGPRTANRKRLAKGDKIIFYQTGQDGKKFVGTAILDSALLPRENEDQFDFVFLANILTWKNPVHLAKVASKLSFVQSKEKLHFYFQTGIRAITENDYRLIENYAKRQLVFVATGKYKNKVDSSAI